MNIYIGIAAIVVLIGIRWIITDYYDFKRNNPLGYEKENSKQCY